MLATGPDVNRLHPPLDAQLQATLNLIPAYVWYAVPAGALTFVNERIADYLGLPQDHPLRSGTANGAEWDSHIPLLHADDHEETRRVWSACLRTGSAGKVSFRVRSAEGDYRWFLSRAEPVRAIDGTLLYWIGVNLEIDEQKRAEQELRDIFETVPALVWVAENAADLGAGGPGEGAPPRIGVMGESAGGNLAAVTCLLARDRGGPRISHQALLYPPTDMTRMSPGAATSLILNAPEMLAYRRHYLGDADPADPRASPLLAGDHQSLPPALIQVGEHDPLRDDGVRYAAVLRSAGVPVRFTEYVGMPHGYLNFPGICRSARQALGEICAEQAAALAEPAAAVPGTPHDHRDPAASHG